MKMFTIFPLQKPLDMWLLDTWNVAREIKNLIFYLINLGLSSQEWLVATVLDSAALRDGAKDMILLELSFLTNRDRSYSAATLALSTMSNIEQVFSKRLEELQQPQEDWLYNTEGRLYKLVWSVVPRGCFKTLAVENALESKDFLSQYTYKSCMEGEGAYRVLKKLEYSYQLTIFHNYLPWKPFSHNPLISLRTSRFWKKYFGRCCSKDRYRRKTSSVFLESKNPIFSTWSASNVCYWMI